MFCRMTKAVRSFKAREEFVCVGPSTLNIILMAALPVFLS